MTSDLRFPIGTFTFDSHITPEKRDTWIRQIADAPDALRAAVSGLNDRQLDTPYRPGGWTVRQVVHHVPDSHMNAYVRFKLALTEDNPTIKPYDEAEWADVADTRATAPEVSLTLLDALHRRWVTLLQSMAPADFARPLQHPQNGPMTLDRLLQLYAWHGRHHAAHITTLRTRERF
ncbi:MAG: putative metal-dependent hydrolase [Acidobacteria bacterium]|nr:putative metal-dependent hydrolase [Acidobacteriota bacterium]MCA1650007.1 putative metal-dependent hydrolase [Acidobacteriota bacterium]